MENEDERAQIMEQLKRSQETSKALMEQLKVYAECDPDAFEKLKEDSKVCLYYITLLTIVIHIHHIFLTYFVCFVHFRL